MRQAFDRSLGFFKLHVAKSSRPVVTLHNTGFPEFAETGEVHAQVTVCHFTGQLSDKEAAVTVQLRNCVVETLKLVEKGGLVMLILVHDLIDNTTLLRFVLCVELQQRFSQLFPRLELRDRDG